MISCLKAPTPLTVKSVVPLGIIGVLPSPNTVYYIRNFISLSLYSKELFQLKTKHDFQKAETERSFSEPGKFFLQLLVHHHNVKLQNLIKFGEDFLSFFLLNN